MNTQAVIRILDASLNRATEGLRVVEDYVRFVLDDSHLTEQFKQLRHDLAAAAASFPLSERHAARDTPHDVGTAISTPAEGRREGAWSVCVASLERVKQSLRSLEEFAKVTPLQGEDSPGRAAAEYETLRYWLYTLEAALGRTVDAVQRLAGVRLYVLIDGCASVEAFTSLVLELTAAGVDAIQLREKGLSDRELASRARALVSIVRESQAPLAIVNDRADIAAAVNADGVHLGQDDLSVKDARALLGPRKLIGLSTHSIEQARAAVLDGANYIGVGPTFPSATKSFTTFAGVALLQQIAADIRLPAFAIGGISATNLDEVLAAGASRVAVSSAVTAAPSPAAAASQLRTILNKSPVTQPQ